MLPLYSCCCGHVQEDNFYARCTVPFLACGDLSGWDADRSYAIDTAAGGGDADSTAAGAGSGYVCLEPVQKPVHPAYKTALEQRRKQGS